MMPTIHEALDHLAEHYGMTRGAARALVRTPLHPQTLRDDFAMHAVAGVAATNLDDGLDPYDLAHDAYRIADAMLETRLPKEQTP